MRNSMKMMCLLLLILILCVPVTASKTAKETAIRKGDIYKVTLNENPRTGYTWSVISSDGLEKLSEKLTPSKSCLVKATGTRELKFQAIKTGKQTITGKYQRPPKKVSIKSFSIALNVI
jgi:predicted secreted protein